MQSEFIPSRLDTIEVVDQNVGIDQGTHSGPLAPEPPLVLQAIDLAASPYSKCVFPFAHRPRIEIACNRATHGLGARDPLPAAGFVEPSNLFVREIYDRPHGS